MMKIGSGPLDDERAHRCRMQNIQRIPIKLHAAGIERHQRHACCQSQHYAQQVESYFLPARVSCSDLPDKSCAISDEQHWTKRKPSVQVEPKKKQKRYPDQKAWPLLPAIEQP